MIDKTLAKARKLYDRRLYDAVTELLEPQIFRFREEEEFYRILGLACLYKRDWQGVETYLQRYRQLSSSTESEVLLGLALACVKKQEFQEAIKLFLKVLDHEPGQSRAKRGLNLLRQALSKDEPSVDLRAKPWLAVFPHPHRNYSKVIFIFLGLLLILALGAGVGWCWVNGFPTLASAPHQEPVTGKRPGPGAPPPSSTDVTQPGGVWKVMLKDDEVREVYEKAQKYFQDYRDSLARIEINRILLSNASQAMKEKARAIVPFLRDPDIVTFQDSPSYGDVHDFPALYEGAAVKWKGVISHLQNGKTEISFDFLLGYEDAQVVQAVLPVKLYFPALLKNSQVIELLALVDKTDPLELKGIALRDLGYRKP